MARRKAENVMRDNDNGTGMKRLLTVKQAAGYLGIAPGHLYNLISATATKPFPVKPKRIGGAVRFDIRDLERYVDGL